MTSATESLAEALRLADSVAACSSEQNVRALQLAAGRLVYLHGPALLAALRLREWRPIESAPKDGTPILVSCPGIGVVLGKWRDDAYAKNPRPYWSNDAEFIRGKISTRADQPTHWMPMPMPPTADDLARVLEGGE